MFRDCIIIIYLQTVIQDSIYQIRQEKGQFSMPSFL